MSPQQKKMRCRYVHFVKFEIEPINKRKSCIYNLYMDTILFLEIFPRSGAFKIHRVFSSGKTFSPSLDVREVWQIQIRILSSSNIMDYISKIQESGQREELGDVNSLSKVRLRILGDF